MDNYSNNNRIMALAMMLVCVSLFGCDSQSPTTMPVAEEPKVPSENQQSDRSMLWMDVKTVSDGNIEVTLQYILEEGQE